MGKSKKDKQGINNTHGSLTTMDQSTGHNEKETHMNHIPLWEAYGNHAIGIEVHQTEDKSSYQAAITVILDDGEELPEDPEQHKGITIFLDFYGDTPVTTIASVAVLLGQLFQNIIKNATEFDANGELVKTHDLEKVMKSFHKKQASKNKSNVTFGN